MLLYRVGNFIFKKKVPVIPKIFNLLIRVVHNSAIYCDTSIGEGTKFGYGGIAVVIHQRAVIGKGCTIGSCVTIGGRSKSRGVPMIGDRVYIATGAKILGDITIGNDVVVGANSVVINDVPSNCVVAGVPARIIKRNISSRDYY